MGLLYILIPAIALTIMFNRKIEETFAVSFMIIMLVIYAPARWMKLTSGFIIAMIICGASLIYILFKLITTHVTLRDKLFTWGGLAVLLYAVFFAYYSYHRDFSHPDELYCWGLMAKNFYYYDSMFSPLSTALAANQTPILPLLDYFFAKAGLSYNDAICYYAQNMFTVSLLLPVFSHIRTKMKNSVFGVFMLIIPSLLTLSGLESFWYILGDMVIAAALCFFMMNIIRFFDTGEYYYYAAALISLLSICLIKRLGTVFASIAIFVAVPGLLKKSVVYIRELSGLMVGVTIVTISWFGIYKYDIIPVAALAGGLVLYYLIGVMGRISDDKRGFVSGIAILMIIGAIFGYMIFGLGKSAFAYGVLARFMEDLFRISTDGGFLEISYGFYMAIAIITGLILKKSREYAFLNSIDEEVTDTMGTLLLWTGISMIVYAVFMLKVHIWQIGPMNDNMEGLIPRYMIPLEIIVVFLIIYTVLACRKEAGLISLCVSLIIVFMISDTGELYRQLFAKHQCVGYNALSDAGIELKAGDLVYFIDEQNYFTYTDREFYYRMWPAKTNFIDQIFMGNSGRIEFSADELEQMIASEQYLEVPYDYLYLQTIDDDFADRYGRLFESRSDIIPGHAYYVITDGSSVKLRLIE